ncbi:MAG: hypothetical protein IJ571_03505 [Ruminococcus sp.]|nr:hypothetical protein [Ruminococcus sp.]
MKKICISLSAALIITVAGGAAPSIRAEGLGFFVPSQSVMVERKKSSKEVELVRPKHFTFGFALGEFFEKLFD